MKKGFSLIELAISIVIIGLIVAGITTGANLIKDAELKKIILNFNELKSSISTFQTKYGSLPGDMTDASVFFADCAETASNCNGNGNREISWSGDTSNEVYKAMLHLDRAGMLTLEIPAMPDSHNGDMNGRVFAINDENNGYFIVGGPGESSPPISIASGTIQYSNINTLIYYGKYDSSRLGYVGSSLTAEDAFTLDAKLDDGSTRTGSAQGFDTGKFIAVGGDCTFPGSRYQIDNNSLTCYVGLQID